MMDPNCDVLAVSSFVFYRMEGVSEGQSVSLTSTLPHVLTLNKINIALFTD